jgi:hypothetical protein
VEAFKSVAKAYNPDGMNQFVNWLAGHAKDIWSVAGPLVGVLIGAYVANRNQRKHWIADSKKQEYRELLTALTRAFGGIVQVRGPGIVALQPADQRAYSEMETEALQTIRDRLFISDEVKQMDLLNRWTDATRSFDNTHNYLTFSTAFGKIAESITCSAKKLLK